MVARPGEMGPARAMRAPVVAPTNPSATMEPNTAFDEGLVQ
jgi:hypothetical protein